MRKSLFFAACGKKPHVGTDFAYAKAFGVFSVEGVVFDAFVLDCPDEGFSGVGEPHSKPVGHRVGFYPDNIVQNPKAQILHDFAYPEDVVVGAHNPKGSVRLHYPPDLQKQTFNEAIILLKGRKAVPLFKDSFNQRF